MSRDFLLLVFFHESVSPQPQIIPFGTFRIFSKICGDIRKSRCTTDVNDPGGKLPPVSTTPAANLPPVSATRWQTMRTTSGCRYLKVNLKAKLYIYVNSTIQRCPNKIFKIFLIEDFFYLPPVLTTLVVNLELRIYPQIFEKIRNGPNGIYSGAWRKLIREKTRSRKSRGTVPLLGEKPIIFQ